MIRPHLSLLAALLLVLGPAAPARGSDPVTVDAEAQMTELYKKMAITLGGSLDAGSMLVLAAPGLMLTEDFDGENNLDDQGILNDTVDTIPKASAMFSANGGARYSDLYRKIVENRQFPPQFRQELTASERNDLAAAIALTSDSSPEKKAYNKWFDIYWAAVAEADNAEQSKARNAAMLRAKVGKAATDWISNGYKTQITAALGRIQSLTAKSGDAWWGSLQEKMAKTVSVGGYLPAAFFPRPSSWAKDEGWTSITFTYGEKADSGKSRSEAIKAAVQGAHSWFSMDASFTKEDFEAKSLMAHKDLQVSMQVKRVNVYRRWFDQDVLRNQYWDLPTAVSGGAISYGTLARNARAPLPAMPLYVSSIFLVRNLTLKTRIDKAEMSAFLHAMSVKARIGLGPFTLSGGYDKRDKGHENKSAVSEVGITAAGLQIAGYLGTVPPRCPAYSVK